jgi:DNA topoisomerase-1
VLGTDPETGLQVFVKVGRFGPYFQLGEAAEKKGKKGKKKTDKPKMASLLAGMEPETVTLEEGAGDAGAAAHGRHRQAQPRGDGRADPGRQRPLRAVPQVGQGDAQHPGRQHAADGHDGAGTGSCLRNRRPAVAAAVARPRRRRAARSASTPRPRQVDQAARRPLRAVRHRWHTNASLGKDENPDELTLARALELLAARAAKGPAKKKPARRAAKPAAAKPAGAKKAAPKKAKSKAE